MTLLTKHAHSFWLEYLQPGSTAIDATCGNGHDTLFLAQTILTPQSGHLIAMDIQPEALAQTDLLLQSHLSEALYDRIELINQSHTSFPISSANLICYNLGYLPGSDKQKQTLATTTLISITEAIRIIEPRGLISIMCYVGHTEGKKELHTLEPFLESLDSKKYKIYTHTRLHANNAPILFLIEKQASATSHQIKASCNQ